MTLDRNDSKTWLDASIHTPPPFAVSAYQDRINAICGTYGDKPNILLSWMPSMTNYTRYYCEWNTAGFGTKTHLRGQYVYETLYDADDNPVDVPPPRWALKQLVHPAQYLATDETTRWKKQTIGHQTKVQESRPPLPDHGYYAPFLAIGKHNGICCKTAKDQGEKCWGGYRKPDETYLTLLKRAIARRDSETNVQRADQALTHETLMVAAMETAQEIKKREEITSKHLDTVIDNNLPELVSYYANDESFVERKKAFSLPSQYTQTATGIVIPK